MHLFIHSFIYSLLLFIIAIYYYCYYCHYCHYCHYFYYFCIKLYIVKNNLINRVMYIYIYVKNILDMALIFRWIQLLQPCPAAGTFEMAAKPLGTSANFKPADGDK